MRNSRVRRLLATLAVGCGLFVALPARAQSGEAAAAEEGAVSPADKARSEQLTPPIALPTREETIPKPVNPWFVRPPFLLTPDPASVFSGNALPDDQQQFIHDWIAEGEPNN